MQSWDLDAMGPSPKRSHLGLLHLPTVRLPPLHELVPSDGARPALVSP